MSRNGQKSPFQGLATFSFLQEHLVILLEKVNPFEHRIFTQHEHQLCSTVWTSLPLELLLTFLSKMNETLSTNFQPT